MTTPAKVLLAMVPQLALLWLSDAPPSDGQQAQLTAWGRSHNVQLHAPQVPAALIYDPAVAESIELELEAVRTTSALDPDDALKAVDRAQAAIVANPQLPQAAWLLAECYRLRALMLARTGNALEAAENRASAEALQGPSAATYDEQPGELAPLKPRTAVEVEVIGPRASDVLFLDGERNDARALLTAGVHHLRVQRGDAVVWSDWLQVPNSGGSLNVPIEVPACSDLDVQVSDAETARPTVARDVQCLDWAMARPHPGGIEIALCRRNSCGNFTAWPPPSRDQPVAATAGGSPWYLWPLVGAGVALGTAAVLWQTGAFDRDQPPGRPIEITGPRGGSTALQF